jgi:TfoX/Sxy family transcriptional regulator of competence genes
MAYDAKLAARIRETLGDLPGLAEKKMFGGAGYLILGNMACGVHGDSLIVRVGPEGYEAALSEPGARPFDLTGRPMKGWVYVDPEALSTQDDLERWVQQGVDFALSLPPKA